MNTGKQVSGEVIIQQEEMIAAKLYANAEEDTLLYHNGSIKDDSGKVIDANDESYRFSGPSDKVNNYVCLDNQTVEGDTPKQCTTNEDLYRIIGLFKNGNEYEMKLIKATAATKDQLGTDGAYKIDSENKYYWASSDSSSKNLWKDSLLNTVNLNEYYLKTYLETEGRKEGIVDQIEAHEWITAGNTWSNIGTQTIVDAYKNEIKEPNGGNLADYNKAEDEKTEPTKIGLMYVSDYGYAAYPDAWTTKIGYDSSGNGYNNTNIKANNWMSGNDEWTITRQADSSIYAFIVASSGDVGSSNVYLNFAVRPSFYLSSSTEIASGKGTSTNPYRLSWEGQA